MVQETHTEGGVLEFNANVSVLERFSKIITQINTSRYNVLHQIPNVYGVLEDPSYLITHIISAFKEIAVELKGGEGDELLEELNNLRQETITKKQSLFGVTINPKFQAEIFRRIDQADMKMRAMAKKHGFLARNIKSSRGVMLE